MMLSFNFNKISAILLFMIIPSLAFAIGGMEGGGGKSIVCRDPQGKITKAEVLDLFEGRTQYQLQYTESQTPWREQVLGFFKQAGISTNSSPRHDNIFDWYQNSILHLNILSEDVSLKETNDSFEVVVPKGCKVEQAAIYQTDNQILISGEIWNAFSETQKAALLIHESSYRFLRMFGETNSIRARHFTAHLLSGGKIEELSPLRKNVKVLCGVSGFKFDTAFVVSPSYTDENGIKKARLQFSNIGGRELLSKTFADIEIRPGDGELWEELLNPSHALLEHMTTTSSFESGDDLNLWVVKKDSGEIEISVWGTSAINGSSFTSQLKCFPLPQSK